MAAGALIHFQGNTTVQGAIEVFVNQWPELQAIYFFSSRANDSMKKNSDWDFGLLPERSVDPLNLWKTKEALEIRFSTDFDLVDLRAASTVLQFEVLKTSKLVYSSDEFARQEYEYLVLSYYQKLSDERRDILTDIYKRGTVYG